MEGEKPKFGEYGGSLPVDNVQALPCKNLKDIPHRYIRPESELGEVSLDKSLQIPVIDISKLCDDRIGKTSSSMQDGGFFQLINHGIPEATERMKVVTEFFRLPWEEKMTRAQLPTSIEGYGQAFVVSEDQRLDWGDMLFLLSRPVQRRNMGFWPTNPQFRSSLEAYSLELQELAISFLRLMARNLGLDLDAFTTLYEDGVQGIRMNYYPPCQEASQVMGLTTHSDATGLTLLIQVNDVSSLQIKKDGNWVPIKPLPDAVIINIGDIMEIMSNGEYSGIEHRGMVNPDKERLSIAGFHSPNMSAVVGPLTDLVKEGGAKYKTVDHEKYVKNIASSKLDGKSLLDYMRIKQ